MFEQCLMIDAFRIPLLHKTMAALGLSDWDCHRCKIKLQVVLPLRLGGYTSQLGFIEALYILRPPWDR
jgi:hypothetical protein